MTTRDLPTGTVTFVFTDIEGSTAMLQRLGDAFVEVLEDHNEAMRSALATGTEVRSEGDAFFYAFSSAPDALRAAVDAQRRLDALTWPEGGTVRVRMGMHTGEGTAGGDDYVGLDVHRAARIAAAGHGGQILLSDAARVLASSAVTGDITTRDLGEHRFKDLDQPERVHQVVVRDLPADFPPIRSLDAAPNNLPVQPTAFVGRDHEVEEVSRLLQSARMVTLTGPGGTGKTRLAVHVASESLDRFSDGIYYVPLESVRGSELVLPTIATELGVADEGAVPDRLGSGASLLVLDNFEHVIDAAPEIAALLGDAPGVTVLVTSQAPLRLRGEQIYPVPPLDAGEGVELFVDLVAATDPTFQLTDDNRDIVERIVARLEGMPLAIELTAPRVQLFGLAGLDDRLSERLEVPATGFADLPERHRTLAAAIAWSYELLGEGEQSLLRQLGVFDGGFTLDAAEAVAVPGPAIDVVEGVASLLDRSLLRQQVKRGGARFFMLESIRQFALDALNEAGEFDAAAQRHGEYFAELAETARPILGGAGQEVWLDRLADEYGNIRAVLRRSRDAGQPDPGLRTAGSIWQFYHRRGHLVEGREWLELLLQLPGASPLARAEGMDGLAAVTYWQADYEGAERLYTEVLDLFRGLGDQVREADTLFALSTTTGWRGDLEAGLAFAEEARTLYEEAGAAHGAARVTGTIAWTTWQSGHLEEALELWAEARAMYIALGDFGEQRQADVAAAAGLHQLGRDGEAVALLGDTLEAMVEADDVSGTVVALDFLASVTVFTAPEPAVRLAGAAAQLRAEMGGGLSAEAANLEPVRSGAGAAMEAGAIDASWDAGAELSFEEAVELGRAVVTAGASAPID